MVSKLRRSWRGALGALALGVVACVSPTLPLPPPALPSIEPASTPGHLHLSSDRGAEPNAIVVIVNPALPNDQRVFGAQADARGSWDADVVASKGNVLQITQESGNERSPTITVQVP